MGKALKDALVFIVIDLEMDHKCTTSWALNRPEISDTLLEGVRFR